MDDARRDNLVSEGRALGAGHSLTDEERKTIQTRIELILNARAGLEKVFRAGCPPETGWSTETWNDHINRRALDIYDRAATIAGDLVGLIVLEMALPTIGDGPEQIREGLITRLRLNEALIAAPRSWQPAFRAVIMELICLRAGDQPKIFAPSPRLPGQSRHPMWIAHLRLQALAWNVHLKWRGISAVERQTAIAVAFRTSWDAIRKWRAACDEVLGAPAVAAELRSAERATWIDFQASEWKGEVKAAGSAYWSAWKEERSGKAGP